MIADNRDKLPADVVTEVEADVAAVKAALESDADCDAIKAAMDKLNTSSQKIGQALYAAQAEEAAAEGAGDNPFDGATADDAADDETIVDAEIVDED
jgi:molecular chaperone DnaK